MAKLSVCQYPKYLARVKDLRSDDSLLVTHSKPHKRPTAQTVARWLVTVIQLSYEAQNKPLLGKVTGHSTRALGPSIAEFKGVSVEDIIAVADWSAAKTFYGHYYRRMINSSFQSAVFSVSDQH